MNLQDLQLGRDPVRNIRTVLVLDVVESVRLMEQDEHETIRRWQHVVDRVSSDIVVAHGGRVVKSLGDGLMLEFAHAHPATRAAFAIQRTLDAINQGVPPERLMLGRIGLHSAEVVTGESDIFGHGVNIAARLTTLAGPGEIVVSAEVRDQLTDDLDADIEDLGECILKHVREPVRAYRVGAPGPRPVIEPGSAARVQLRPAIAVIPFSARVVEPKHLVLGDVFADDIISALSRSADLHVISRLSTSAFRDRDATPGEIGGHLKVSYVLSGSYRVTGPHVVLIAELVEVNSGEIVWSETFRGKVNGVLRGQSEAVDEIVARVSAAILMRELARAQSHALPTLESYTLLMSGIALLHRLSSYDFHRAREMFEALIDRAPRQAVPRAWLAKWHVMRVQQGWSEDPRKEGRLALYCTRRALDSDPECALALTIDGLVHTCLLKKFDVALERYQAALESNPNESLAWLLKGTLHAFKGEGAQAVAGTEHALRLSPLDPLRSYYDSLAATAALSAGHYERAIELARRSLRANRTHTSTLRAMAISQWLLGREDDARATVVELMRLEPGLTVASYRDRSPSSDYETGRVWSDALRNAGVPE